MKITLAHGAGGLAMQRLIREHVLEHFGSAELARMEDAASLAFDDPQDGARLAFTSDGFVVDPIEFPGGDIGRLCICGTVNDLAMMGARPRWISCALIIEEGFDIAGLDRLLASAAAAAAEAGVEVVCGDTKVVPRGAADKLFITTSGIGIVPPGRTPASSGVRAGDAVLVSGDIGRHGAAIVAAREDLHLSADIESDCAPLNSLVEDIFAAATSVRCLRDATRGGIAAVLNEIAEASACAFRIDEAALPIDDAVNGLCELLGLDPLHLAAEGCLVAVVDAASADAVLAAMREHPRGRRAARLGEALPGPAGRVILDTAFGGERIVDMLVGEPLPRIC